MKIVECVQGSAEWIEARLAVATASQFHRLVTPAKLQRSAQLGGYGMELLAEWLIGEPVSGDAESPWLTRGRELEDRAAKSYEWDHGVETVAVGFCLTDDGFAGCSPDRLVGEDGGLEIKCPGAKEHVAYLLDGFGSDHMMQVQGGLFVTGRAWWDLVSFCPGLPAVERRIVPDAKYQEALGSALADLRAFVERGRATLLALGCESRLEAMRGARARAESYIDNAPDPVPEVARKTMADEDFEGEVCF